MYKVGEFASIGRVTVRLLHYYDEIGLLKPAHVDPDSGYRSYGLNQVAVLNRILQLRDFGMKLDVVTTIIHCDINVEEERELVRRCRDQLREQIADNTRRLVRLDAYLRATEGAVMKPDIEAELKRIEPQRVAYLTEHAGGWGNANIGPVIAPLFGKLADTLATASIGEFGPAIAIYEADESGDGTTVSVTAAFVVDDSVEPGTDFQVTTLPAIDVAAVSVHRGSPDTIDQSWHLLMDWTHAEGYELSGVCRELYLTPGDVPMEQWMTELQQPARKLAD
jgi:DNA-binding transcriptional MerR regulator/predicted transcriptional regulator YdeE